MESKLFGYPEKVDLEFQSMRLFSEFDSGNLANAVVHPAADAYGKTHIELYISKDCQNTPYANSYATWFYFGLELYDPTLKACFTVMNSNNIKTLLTNGHYVAWKSREGSWQRVNDRCYNIKLKDKEAVLQYSFDFDFSKEAASKQENLKCSLPQGSHILNGLNNPPDKGKKVYFFAFNFPWSYEDNTRWIGSLLKAALPGDIEVSKSELCKSREKKEIALLTISKGEGEKKKHIIISGRIHPYETTSSFAIKGFVEALISQQTFFPLLEHFVFKIVPMLNPDGVYRGYTRSNSLGQNLNRCFIAPNPDEQPEVFAFDKLVASLAEKSLVELVVDFHMNIKKEGIFLYGNSIEDFWVK